MEDFRGQRYTTRLGSLEEPCQQASIESERESDLSARSVALQCCNSLVLTAGCLEQFGQYH